MLIGHRDSLTSSACPPLTSKTAITSACFVRPPCPPVKGNICFAFPPTCPSWSAQTLAGISEISLCDRDTPATIGRRPTLRHRRQGHHPVQQQGWSLQDLRR